VALALLAVKTRATKSARLGEQKKKPQAGKLNRGSGAGARSTRAKGGHHVLGQILRNTPSAMSRMNRQKAGERANRSIHKFNLQVPDQNVPPGGRLITAGDRKSQVSFIPRFRTTTTFRVSH
jgi:hypothetical protein